MGMIMIMKAHEPKAKLLLFFEILCLYINRYPFLAPCNQCIMVTCTEAVVMPLCH